jgi:hypothetical protein
MGNIKSAVWTQRTDGLDKYYTRNVMMQYSSKEEIRLKNMR